MAPILIVGKKQNNQHTNRITSFDSDGVSLGANAEGNTNGDTYVAWCWKINGGTTETHSGRFTNILTHLNQRCRRI